MKRDKNGRFLGTKKNETTIPSLSSFLKYFLLLIVFLPWAYLSITKLDLISFTKNALTSLFGPIKCDCECECPTHKNPY